MSKQLQIIFFVAFNVICLFPLRAQHKTHLPYQVWPEVQAEYVFKSRNFLFFRNQYRYNTNPKPRYLGSGFPGDHLERIQFRLGYEHLLSNKWSVGGSEMFGLEALRKLLFTDIYTRHTHLLAGLQIMERLTIDYLWYSNSPTQVGRLRPRLDVDKVFKLSHWNIRPRVGYELFINTYFNNEMPVTGGPINRTRLRFETSFQPNPHLLLTPFYTKQTDFLQTKSQTAEETDYHAILPIWGVELRYVFFQGKVPFNRQALPIQQN